MSTALQGIFHNGVAGMLAFEQGMGAISDNISNQNTVGYKRVETLFSTVLGQVDRSVKQGDSASAVLQARNVAGVKPTTRQLVDVQGAILGTSRPYDMAISGQGMFMFATGTIDTAGTLTLDTDHVMYSRAGDLSPFVGLIDDGAGTLTADGATYLTNKNGQYLLAQDYTAADILAGVTTPTGAFVPVQTSDQNAFGGLPTATASLSAVIPASGATTVTTPLYFVDANGDQVGMTLEFSNPVVVAGTSTTWDLTTYDDSGTLIATTPGAVVFDNSGAITTGSAYSHTQSGTTFTIDLSEVVMLGDSTSGTTTQAVQISYSHDGLPAGALEGLEIHEDGIIYGKYSGGVTQPLYRIPLASFSNPNGLMSLAGNMYEIGSESGEPTLRFPGDEFAHLVLSSVENANVDLADSFSQMIIIQRAYSSAATVVRTADEMSSTVRDLMR